MNSFQDLKNKKKQTEFVITKLTQQASMTEFEGPIDGSDWNQQAAAEQYDQEAEQRVSQPMLSSHHAEMGIASDNDDDDAQYNEGQDDDDDEENLNDYDQEQEELDAESEESADQSDDSAPHFCQIKHLLKRSQTQSVKQSDKDDLDEVQKKSGNEEQRMSKWMRAADKINRALQGAAGFMTKEAQTMNLGAQYVLNSYAFHSRQLVNTIQAYLPAGFDKTKIETLFVENNSHENTHQELMLFSENLDKIRKRVLISSTFATASKANHVLKIFEQLRNCKYTAPQLFKRVVVQINQSTNPNLASNSAQTTALNAQRDSLQQLQITPVQPIQQRVFRKDLQNTLTSLTQKYDPNSNAVSSVTPNRKTNIIILPSMPEPMKKPKNLDLDDFSEDEQYYKHRNQMLKYNSWRYSLLCQKNVVYLPREESESPKKVSSSGMTGRGVSGGVGRSPKALANKKGTNSQFTQQVLQPQKLNQDMYGHTLSPSGNYVNTSSGMRYYIKPNASNQAGPYNRISHKSNKLGDDQSMYEMSECPVHSKQNPVGLTQFDLGSVIDNLGGRATNSQMQATPVNSDKIVTQKEKQTTFQNGKTGFVNNNRTSNPFKQDRTNQTQVSQQIMTINGVKKQYSRGAVISNSQKKIAYDPNIIAHMAKMYMVPTHQQHKQVQAALNKKSLFPQHIQQQLLMKDDEPATIYNRQNGPPRQDALMQRAVEDLMKKKIMFQAANAQQLYSQIYNTEVQILCTEQGQLQYQREIVSGSTKQNFETDRASQAHPSIKEVSHHRKTNSVLVSSTNSYPKERFKRESHMSGKTGIAQQQQRLNKKGEDYEIASKRSSLQQHNSQSQRRRHIQVVRQREQSLSHTTELTPIIQQQSMLEKQIQSIDVEFRQNSQADYRLVESTTNPSSKHTQAHQQYHHNIPSQNLTQPSENRVELSSATENKKTKSNLNKTIDKQGIDLTNKNNDSSSIQDIKEEQSRQVRHQTEIDRNSIVYNNQGSNQSEVSHLAKAVHGVEGTESNSMLASAVMNRNQPEQEHKLLSPQVNQGIFNMPQTKAPITQNNQSHKQAQVNKMGSAINSSYEDQIMNRYKMQRDQHGMHQVKNMVNLESKDQGSSTNLHTTEQNKLSQESNSLLNNYQSQALQSNTPLGQDMKSNSCSKSNSIASQQDSNSGVYNNKMIQQNQKEQMALESKQQTPHQTSNKLHSSENFTNKLQKIKRTKPHQSSSPLMQQNKIKDPCQNSDILRHLNSKAGAQSPTKMTQMQGSLNSPQILSNMQSNKVLGSSRFPSSEIMEAAHNLRFKQSSNVTNITSQQPENHIRHKTHQLNVTRQSRNGAVDSSSMSRINISNKSRSSTRKKTHTQKSSMNMDSHQLGQPQAPSAKKSRYKRDSQHMAIVKDKGVTRIPSKMETNSNNEHFLDQVQIRGSQVNPLSSNSKSQDRQQLSEQLKIKQSSNENSTKNNLPLTSSTKETINLNSLGSSRKSCQAPSSYNNCNQPLSSQSQLIKNMYHKRKLTMGETNSQYRQIVDKTQALQNLSQTRQIIQGETFCQKQQTRQQQQLKVVQANQNTSSMKETKNLEKPMQSTSSNIVSERLVQSIKLATAQSSVQRIFHNVDSEYQVNKYSSINSIIAHNTTQQESLKLKNQQNHTHQDKQISQRLKSSNKSKINNDSQTREQVDRLKSQQQRDIKQHMDRQTLASKQQRHLSHETHKITTQKQQEVLVTAISAQQSNVKFKKMEGAFHRSGSRQRVWLQEDPSNKQATYNQDYIDQTGQIQKSLQFNDPYNIQKIQKIGGISSKQQQLIASQKESTSLPMSNFSSQRSIWQAPIVLPHQQLPSPNNSQTESLGKTMPSLSNRTGGIVQTSQRIPASNPLQQSDSLQKNRQRVQQPSLKQTTILNSHSHRQQEPQIDSNGIARQGQSLKLSMLNQKPKQNTLTYSNLIPKESIMYSNNPMGK